MGKRKHTYEEVYNIFLDKGYTLLTTEYINNKQQLEYICPNGHKHHVRLANFITGYGCPYCYGNIKYTYKEVREYIEKQGYKLLSTEYINTDSKLKLECPEGHKYETTFYRFKNKENKCPYCYGNAKHNYEEVKEYIEKEGFMLLSVEYINNKSSLDIQCPKGHIFHPTLDNFQHGTRCPYCAKKYKGEENIANYLSSWDINYARQYKFEKCKNNRVLPFDFYLLDYNICIEYNGEQHYNPVDFAGKGKEWAENKLKNTQNVDNIKSQYCKDNNIKLIIIPYFEFDNIEKILKKELNI